MLTNTHIKSALTLIMTLTMTTTVLAQSNPQPAPPAPIEPAKDAVVKTTTVVRADALLDSAAILHEQPARYADAARFYRESAALRPWADAAAVEALAKAAHLYGYANRLTDARRTMEQAAQRALARGDVVRASIANVEAAFFAQKQGNKVHASRLGRAALQLAESPLITPGQRALIVDRVKELPAANAAATAKANSSTAVGN